MAVWQRKFRDMKGMVITMERRDKTNYYLDIARKRYWSAEPVCGVISALLSSKMTRSSPPDMSGAPRGRENCSDLGYCTREKLKIPRGQRYELCRSVHAEQNAIIAASRNDMIGATLYLVGRDVNTGELVPNASACSMCKRMIINAGIDRVVIRNTPTEYTEINVLDWVRNDESWRRFGILTPILTGRK